MNGRARAGAAAGVAILVMLGGLVIARGGPAVVYASGCGGDSAPPCPVINRLDPQTIEKVPTAPTTISILGSDFGTGISAVVEPAGSVVVVTLVDPTHLQVVIPAADLPAGASVRIALRVDGLAADVSLSPPLAVIDPAAVPPTAGPSLLPAPVAVATPLPVPAPQAATVPAAPGAGFPYRLLLWIVTLGTGGAATLLLVAQFTGVIAALTRYRDFRRRWVR